MENFSKVYADIKKICGYENAMAAHKLLQLQIKHNPVLVEIEKYNHIIREYEKCEDAEWRSRNYP